MRAPQESSDSPQCLPAGLKLYIFNNYATKPRPYHVVEDEVTVPIDRLEVEKIASHRSVLGWTEVWLSSMKTIGRAFSNHEGSERWASNIPGSTFSNTGPGHHFKFNGQTGCIVACASVLPRENSHEIRTPDFCLQAAALSRTKVGHVSL